MEWARNSFLQEPPRPSLEGVDGKITTLIGLHPGLVLLSEHLGSVLANANHDLSDVVGTSLGCCSLDIDQYL